MSAAKGHAIRRSSRVPARVPVRVTSVEPNGQFSEVCETLVVSAHGCALRFPIRVSSGIPLRLHGRDGQEMTAYVVACLPPASDEQGWTVGARLERPGNFWGLESYPEDWRVLEMPSPEATPEPIVPASSAMPRKSQARSAASQAVIDKIEEQLSEERLRRILTKLVRPLDEEVSGIREKLSREARRNRFEVSLGQIPPELEEKLWERLRQDLGARVLQQTREQAGEVLGSTKNEIDKKISGALSEFKNRLSGELHAVEQRAQALSRELTTTTGQQVHAGVEKVQRKALDAGAQLSAKGEELIAFLDQRLVDTSEAHRREIEQIQADAATRSSQLQAEVADLGRRVAALNESVRKIESELDRHLERLAAEIVAGAQTKLESAVTAAFKELQVRGGNEGEARINEVCGHLRSIQNRIENSFSGSLKTQREEAVQLVGQEIEALAQQALEKWQRELAENLKSAAKVLGQQFRHEVEAQREEDQVPTAR